VRTFLGLRVQNGTAESKSLDHVNADTYTPLRPNPPLFPSRPPPPSDTKTYRNGCNVRSRAGYIPKRSGGHDFRPRLIGHSTRTKYLTLMANGRQNAQGRLHPGREQFNHIAMSFFFVFFVLHTAALRPWHIYTNPVPRLLAVTS
jgi:hypothetical protein